MSRETKFRAFSTALNKMIYDNQSEIIKPKYLKEWPDSVFSKPVVTNKGVSFWIYETKLSLASDEAFDHISGLPVDDTDVTEFIGLKDKNLAEIYEGDIVRFTDDVTLPETPLECITEVLWWDVMACFALKNTHTELNFTTVDEMEIIGNIFQNPELLSK